MSLKRYFRDVAMDLQGPVDIYRIGSTEYESLIQTKELLQKKHSSPSTVTGWDVRESEFKIPIYNDGKYRKDHTNSFVLTKEIPTEKGNIKCDILLSELRPKKREKRYAFMFTTSCKGCEKTRYLALKENIDSNVVWKIMVIGTKNLMDHWNPETMRFEEGTNN